MEDKFVQRAKNIISKVLYITIATSTEDGKPWNSPVYSAFDENYNFYPAPQRPARQSVGSVKIREAKPPMPRP